MAKVFSLNINTSKRGPKSPIQSGELVQNIGLKDDIHAIGGFRQLSLLANESVDKMRGLGLKNLQPGVFGENITTEGIDICSLAIGTRLTVGDSIIEITKIGKECVEKCGIYYKVGTCVMPEDGVFAEVIKSGTIKVGDEIKLN